MRETSYKQKVGDMNTLPSPEELAKEILNTYEKNSSLRSCLEAFGRIIQQDRSRLIAYLKENMPKKDRKCDEWTEGWNSAIEAVEKLLGEMR